MNVLIVGNGKGSWDMRGVQLGTAIGARVVNRPSDADMQWADLVVLVKKHALPYAEMVHRFNKPLVWDALDFWGQPGENHVTETQARALLVNRIAAIHPTLVIGATEAMAAACGGVYLPHQSWYGLVPQAASIDVKTVAYQGGEVYLGRWRKHLEDACAKRGWRFVVNPQDLRYADILVAFRDGPWDGWICREWKSGVKLVNAIAAGRPIITQPSAAFHEMKPLGTVIESFDALDDALEAWTPIEERQAVVESSKARAKDFTLLAVADRYRTLLDSVAVTA